MNPILQRMYDLPPELRAIIEGDEVIAIVDEIADKHDIPHDWTGELIKATVKVLSGFMKPDEFIPFIKEEYLVDQDEALHIALDINARIFSAVKPQLASLHKIADERIARRMRVPHKPREAQIAPSTELVAEQPAPVAPSADPAPAERIAPTLEYVPPRAAEGSLPSPMTAHFTPRSGPGAVTATPPPPPQKVPHPIVQAPLASPLSGKLGNMRTDAYREPVD